MGGGEYIKLAEKVRETPKGTRQDMYILVFISLSLFGRKIIKQDCAGVTEKLSRIRRSSIPKPGVPHLAWLLVHVEGVDDTIRDFTAWAFHQILSKTIGQVGFASSTRPR